MTTEEQLCAQFPDLEFCPIPTATDHSHFSYNGFKPSSTILSAGHVKSLGRKKFPIDILYERDCSVPLRDGIHIYTDVFRPPNSNSEVVPALIPWSPYGKTGTGPQDYQIVGPFGCGLSLDQTSGYEKFEGPDPAPWCARGYAIVNVDARGAGMSEGNIHFWGQQEAEDIHDTIEWVSTQPWCNGSVGMIGNSWLAIAQMNYASRLAHPALKALAPLEGFTDPYQDFVARGGIPQSSKFNDSIMSGFAGPNKAEHMAKMIKKRPLYDDYWASKNIHTENIDVPMYLLASYSTKLHSRGSFHAFRTAKTTDKWLRVHPTHEWYDLYQTETLDDLTRYFDYYCKGTDNGWKQDTPPVRLSLLSFEGSPAKTVIDRAENEWPLARQELRTLYLDASRMLLDGEKPGREALVSHEAHNLTASSDFTYVFSEATELAGYPKACLWMSCAEKDDFDVVVQLRKISLTGDLMEHVNYPCPVPAKRIPNVNIAKTLGPQGFLRASHSISKEEEASKDGEVSYRHDRQEKVKPGSIVLLEIPLWPIGMVFAAGEGIMLRVAGHDQAYEEFAFHISEEPEDENLGKHVIHTGGRFESCIVLPVIPSLG